MPSIFAACSGFNRSMDLMVGGSMASAVINWGPFGKCTDAVPDLQVRHLSATSGKRSGGTKAVNSRSTEKHHYTGGASVISSRISVLSSLSVLSLENSKAWPQSRQEIDSTTTRQSESAFGSRNKTVDRSELCRQGSFMGLKIARAARRPPGEKRMV